jgi:hypothetical protein
MRLVRAGIIAMIAVFVLLAGTTAAFAYDTFDPPTGKTCAECHGRESDETTDTVAATRKGPHGGYTTGTSKCQTCHSVHAAPAGGVKLLPGATVKATCESCHDGTGGTGVYGVIERRGGTVLASHSVEATNTIPGGDAAGGERVFSSFLGPGGTLTCSDCHSPHDSQTVEPFTGDRLRAEVASDTAYAGEGAIKTNRLLKRSPSSAETSAAVYGAGWCATCHRGRATVHDEDSGLMREHPVMAVEGDDADAYHYDYLPVVVSVESTETTIGALGQSNRGYIMPEGPDGAGTRTELQAPGGELRGPLCQQCHEDARNVGPTERKTNPMLGAGQEFNVSQYNPDPSEEMTGNPLFQVFPHESDAANFLVRPVEPDPEDTATPKYGLCLNCHSLRHDVPEEYEWCTECHDAGDAADIHDATESGCYACHPQTAGAESLSLLSTTELTLDCGVCHPEPHGDHNAVLGSDFVELFNEHPSSGDYGSFGVVVECAMCHNPDISPAHANRCVTCHPVPRDTFGEWNKGCQQGDCHPTFHDNTIDAHWDTDADGAKCGVCHGGQGGSGGGSHTMSPSACLNCHVGFSASDTTPPVTTSNALATYIGPARIDFSITDSGLIGIGTTFYRVDGGPIQVGSSVFVSEPGVRVLEFWSVDQNSNVESPAKQVTFTIVPDLEAPVTTSNAQAEYFNVSPTITLTAIDNGTLPVKATYYTLNGGAIQSGTRVSVPRPPDGTVAEYVLAFRSEDWSGNLEAWKSVSFTVASGNGTIRLVWGNSDVSGPPGGGAEIDWEVRRDSRSGPIAAFGSAGGEGWSGVVDVVLPVRGGPYFVYILEGESTDYYQTWFDNIYLKVPDDVVRLSY